jgi:hypothetical protein
VVVLKKGSHTNRGTDRALKSFKELIPCHPLDWESFYSTTTVEANYGVLDLGLIALKRFNEL